MGDPLELLGAPIGNGEEGGEIFASLSLSAERIETLVKMAGNQREAAAAFAASLRKLVGNLNPARTAAMGRFGKAALEPIRELLAAEGSTLSSAYQYSLRWWEDTLPSIAPRLILGSRQSGAPGPVRILSDATGEGGLACLTFLPIPERQAPVLLMGEAEEKLRRPSS